MLTLPWLAWMGATHVTMSRPGNSWSSMPVTDTFLPVFSRIWTSTPAQPPLGPIGRSRMLGDMVRKSHFDRVTTMGVN